MDWSPHPIVVQSVLKALLKSRMAMSVGLLASWDFKRWCVVVSSVCLVSRTGSLI